MSDDTRITPETAERYTVEFLPEGRVQVRANCNRGGARYETEAGGRITLGPIATTRMLCPPGSQDTAFLKVLASVGCYKVASAGELWLMLRVDSGTMRFRALPR